MSVDRIAEKVRKLLALASDPGAAPNEAETAARQAAALMAKHQLDGADLQLTRGQGKLLFDLMEGYGRGTRPGKRNAREVPTWIRIIAVGVARFTRTFTTPGSDRVYFKGQRCDVELAIWMHDQIVDTCYQASQASCQGMGMSEANTWRNGYAGAVQRRLTDLAKVRDQVEADTPASASGTSLVVVNTALQEAMAERFGEFKVKSANVSQNLRGRQAGESANLPTNRPLSSGAGRIRIGS